MGFDDPNERSTVSADWFDYDRFLAEFGQLVSRESPTEDLDAIRESAVLIAQIGAAHLGRPPEIIEVEGRNHLRWRFGDGPARVVTISHHDTVWPLGSIERLPYSIDEGRITGPGTADMKGGLLMAFFAAARIRDEHGEDALDGLSILVTADEEIGSPTSRGLIEDEARGAVAALILECSGPGAELKVGRKGVSLYRLEILGRAAHAGVEPERGTNAGIEAARQVLAIAALGDPQLGTTVVPTVIEAGTTINTVPAHAVIHVDSRAATVAEQRRVDSELRALEAVDPGATLVWHGGPNRPPLEPKQAMPLFATAQSLAQSLGHRPLQSISVGGGSDGNFTAGVGTPTLDGLGTVGGGSHADEEHALLEWVPERTELLAELIRELLD